MTKAYVTFKTKSIDCHLIVINSNYVNYSKWQTKTMNNKHKSISLYTVTIASTNT